MTRQSACLLVLALTLAGPNPAGAAHADDYLPADRGQRPSARGTQLLPEQFLRGFDPVTVIFDSDVGPARGDADDGEKLLKIVPRWPGAWAWIDHRTLQFRPAEPWPALQRFAVEAKGGTRKTLTTMMSAPSSLSPSDGADNLRPFRTFTLAFPQALPLSSLKQMLSLEIRDLPGLDDAPRQKVTRWTLAALPRGGQRDAAVYAVTLDEDIPEGKELQIRASLALGSEGTVLWTGKLRTQAPFHLFRVRCGNQDFPIAPGAAAPRDMALACGDRGEAPNLEFSATVADLTLGSLRKLVRLEPSVQDLHFESYGGRVQLKGHFVPDVLYKMRLSAAPIRDDANRPLRDPGDVELFFWLGRRAPFVRFQHGTAVLEANGPRMVPLVGYGDARADVRIHRVDPLHAGLWPFPEQPVVIDEETPPPFPGEEPGVPAQPGERAPYEVMQHLRLLGSPLLSRIIDLPLEKRANTTHLGLDLAPLLDPLVGKNRPGTYLVGLRRLTGPAQRAWVRVQVTNLAVTAAEERDRAVLFVRSLDQAEAVRGAKIALDGTQEVSVVRNGHPAREERPAHFETTTDGEGKATLRELTDWVRVRRVTVSKGDDVLVIDTRENLPRFASNHWSASGEWLHWLGERPPPPVNDRLFAFLFTERPIYRPGEPVFLKGFLRQKSGGLLGIPGDTSRFALRVDGPDGRTFNLPVTWTRLDGFAATFQEKDLPSGSYTATLYKKTGNETLGDRRFQIEPYRVPTFEVQLSSPSVVALDGPFKVKGVARYFAGGNVAGQPISWNVSQRRHYHVPPGREGWLFASSSQFARPQSSRGPQTVRREATLDEKGADEISVNPALDLDGSPRVYHFEATVTGPDEQQVSAVHEVKALPPFTLGLKLPRYLENAGKLDAQVLAVGVDDKPVKGQEVLVRFFRRIWHSQLRETPFATGEAKYVTEQEDVKLGEKIVQSDADPVTVSWPLKDAGVYLVEITGKDKLGRVQTINADLYVGGPGPVAWQKSREGVFAITPDKKEYRPGETARLVIQSPFQSGRALVIVERPEGNAYHWREVAGGKAVEEVKLGEDTVPNLPVHVVLLRGRLGEGATDDTRFRPETVASSLDLKVLPVKNQVTVKVEHPDSAQPGSDVKLTVTLADEDRRPLGGEVTLWLVDEAVLTLAREGPLDPLSRFIEENRRITSIRDTRNLVTGKLFEHEEPGGDGSDEEEKGKKRVVRKNFQTVPYYQATLEVPASGKLVVPVKLSDDLTNFKVRAVAVSGARRFGLHQSVLHVRLPVIIQPQLPRLVREGDRFWPGGVARVLEGPEGAGVVDVEVLGPVDLKGKAKLPAELRQNRPVSALTRCTAGSATEPTEITVRVGVTRKSDGVGDAFEVKLPLLPDRNPEQIAWFERWEPGKVTLRDFPEPPRPGTASEDILVTNVPGVLELVSAIDYLGSYPHECLEQRASRLYPLVALSGVLQGLGLGDLAARRGGPEAKRFVESLPLLQSENGLFAFWPGGTGDVALTAQVVELLHAIRASGLSIDEKVNGRAVEALRRSLRSDWPGLMPGYRFNQQTAALRALTRIGLLDEHYLIELWQLRKEMDATALADLAIAMSARPDVYKANLEALRGDLWDLVITKQRNGKPYFEKLDWRRTGWGGGYLGSNVSAVSAVFEGLLLLDPANARLDLMRDGLVAQGSASSGFGSTHDNRRALEALAVYLEKARTPQARATLSLAGQPDLSVDDRHRVARLLTPASTPFSGTLKGSAVGARVAYRYLPSTPGDQVAGLRQGFVVTRSATPVSEEGALGVEKPDKAGEVRKLKQGEVLELHAAIQNDEERHHVAFVVPFAAGLELMNPALATSGKLARPAENDSITPSYVERRDGEVRYYFTHLARGSYRFSFRVRASSEGSFTHPAPWAELMYRQEVRGRGEGMRIVVTGGHEE